MLNRKALARINDRPRSRPSWPIAVLGVVAATATTYLLFSYLAALLVFMAGVVGVLLVYRRDRAGRKATLVYDLDLETGARFVAIQEACEALAGSEALWLSGQQGTVKAGREGWASPNGRRPVEVALQETPGIDANVDIWGIDTGASNVLFFPEAVLIYQQEQYRAVSYRSLRVSLSFTRFVEGEAVPADAEVVGQQKRSASEYGILDRRHTFNTQLPVVLYGVLRLTGPTGLDVRLMVSNRAAAARFAQAFGARARESTRGDRPRSGSFRPEERERVKTLAGERGSTSSACVTLGVASDASRGEIIAAYRDLARMYHPDKVANLPLEVREFADTRMKEINAAYAELKRR